MARIEVNYIENGGFECKYRICPAFMENGCRVFRKREYEEKEYCSDKIYATEETALSRIEDLLNKKLLTGMIESFEVIIKED